MGRHYSVGGHGWMSTLYSMGVHVEQIPDTGLININFSPPKPAFRLHHSGPHQISNIVLRRKCSETCVRDLGGPGICFSALPPPRPIGLRILQILFLTGLLS